MKAGRSPWLRAATWPMRRAYHAVNGLRRRHWYGPARPAWWPRPWPWELGPSHQHDQREVTLFAGGRRYTFVPVTYGRYHGHKYQGQPSPSAAWLSERLAVLGLDPTKAGLLAAVSHQEGGFDSLQTYDKARLSWGFIQFAGTGGLPALLTRLKTEAPATFEQWFGTVGLDVAPGQLVVRAEGRERRGWRALNYLHGAPRLWQAFVLAAQDPLVQDMQIRAAYEHYLARSGQLLVKQAGQRHRLGALLADHPLGEALRFDRAVARGLGHTQQLFQRAAHSVRLGTPTTAAELIAGSARLDPGYAPRWEAVQRALATTTH